VTGERVELAYVDKGIQLAVVKLPEAKRGFVLLPKRWVVERGFAWATRFRRLTRDDERLVATLAALRFLDFVCLTLHRFTALTLSPEQPLRESLCGLSL
jgi:transposase